jgi:hypothetical protein
MNNEEKGIILSAIWERCATTVGSLNAEYAVLDADEACNMVAELLDELRDLEPDCYHSVIALKDLAKEMFGVEMWGKS